MYIVCYSTASPFTGATIKKFGSDKSAALAFADSIDRSVYPEVYMRKNGKMYFPA